MTFTVSDAEQKKVLKKVLSKLTDILKSREEIIFAYVHGPFLKGYFKDIEALTISEYHDFLYFREGYKREALRI
jgi:hypothetical protein